jgi:2-polyprenyl-6-methoxyphenol hydroxylase-like FAD-dependent oxidoreductase
MSARGGSPRFTPSPAGEPKEDLMSATNRDVIVIGARCAGSPTAMLLARRGYKVLLVDRATFPSDTISTHLIHPPGIAALERWGLLERLKATGCPAIHRYAFDLGPFVIEGAPGAGDNATSYAPRRTVLDKLLVDAAAGAGVEVREGFSVEEILFDDGRVAGVRGRDAGGRSVTERARVVVGADGPHSIVAKAVSPEPYNQCDPLQAGYYTYWSGLPMNGRFEAYDRAPGRAWAAWPTNDDLTLVVLSWPIAEFETNRRDIERHYLEALDRAPGFAERIRGARREDRFYGTAVPNYFRKPFGAGWALVGDAGYMKDFITAQGISDAFRDAESCATALDRWLSGASGFEASMGEYQSARDTHVMPIFEFTRNFAMLAPPSPENQQLFAAIRGNPEAMDGFAQVISGVRSPVDYFSQENIGRIFAAAH